MKELTTKVHNIEITYMQKPRKYDTKHLVVIFSGFGATGEFTYDFKGVMKDCPAEVLWIKDSFNAHCSYYVSQGGKFKVEESVIQFIEMKLRELSLEKENCTLVGSSKGGSAALYFGFKYNFKNIVAAVPQFFIGSYVKKNWSVVAENMMGEVTDEKVTRFDQLIKNAISLDENKEKNVYILTSPADAQYIPEIVPNIPQLEEYSNFNLLVSNSLLARAHNQITKHHLTVVLSLIYSLSAGIAPKYGKRTEFITDQSRHEGMAEDKQLLQVSEFRIEQNGILFTSGYSVIKGRNCGGWGDIQTKLILGHSREGEKTLNLAKLHRPHLTRDLYDGRLVDYDKGAFTTLNFNGIDIKGLRTGVYKLSIRTTCEGVTRTTVVPANKNSKAISDYRGYTLVERNGELLLKVSTMKKFRVLNWKWYKVKLKKISQLLRK